MHAPTLWLTGIPSSGKTSLAWELHNLLTQRGVAAMVIDGDELRTDICADLGFSASDRLRNVSRAAAIAKIANQSGVVAICALVSPLVSMRERARCIVGSERFFEILLDTPLDICMQRDTKGLYAKAQAGLMDNLTGFNAPYEKPPKPTFTVANQHLSARQNANIIIDYLTERLAMPSPNE